MQHFEILGDLDAQLIVYRMSLADCPRKVTSRELCRMLEGSDLDYKHYWRHKSSDGDNACVVSVVPLMGWQQLSQVMAPYTGCPTYFVKKMSPAHLDETFEHGLYSGWDGNEQRACVKSSKAWYYFRASRS
jgi:hypothetical protein